MTRIGITGHSNVTAKTASLVDGHLRKILSEYTSGCDGVVLTGVTCLGRGPDQIFAQIVLDLGGKIEAVIPASDYDNIPDPISSDRYQNFLRQAVSVFEMPFTTSGPEAYFAASKELIRRSDILLAVWDGGPPDGRGGTTDAVGFAQECGRRLVVIWPEGAERE
jgi:hypothetical protein